MPVQQGYGWGHGIIAYGASLETETTFAIVEEQGKYEINVMSIQDFISIPLGQYIKEGLLRVWQEVKEAAPWSSASTTS